MATYAIDIRPRARRSLNQLDPAVRKAVAQTIDALSADPRPPGAAPLKGHRPYLRVRSGDYRVIYAVDDQACVSAIAARSTGGWSCSAVSMQDRRRLVRPLQITATQANSPSLAGSMIGYIRETNETPRMTDVCGVVNA